MDLTIVIPTKNRIFFLERILKYYNDISFKGKILVIDSSSHYEFNKQSFIIKKYNNLQINHFYSAYTPLHAIKEHIDKINTNFVTYCGDDDYHLEEGLKECINFLLQNDEFAASRGKAYLFELNKNNKKIQSIYNYDSYNYKDESGVDRFIKFINHPRAITPNVWRTNIFKKSFNELIDIDKINYCPDRYFYDEILLTSLLIVNGKVKLINTIQFIMTLNSKRLVDRSNWSKINLKDIDTSINYTVNKLTEVIVKNENNNNYKKINNIIKKNLRNFINNKYIPAVRNESKINIKNYIILFLKKVKIYSTLRSLFKKTLINKNEMNIINYSCKAIIQNLESK